MSQLFAVRMDVALPPDMDPAERADLLSQEKAYSQQWQRSSHWRHIWRCAGEYANLSVFDVAGNEQLHDILWNLPLFRYLTMSITPLAGHPSDIGLDGRSERVTAARPGQGRERHHRDEHSAVLP